MHKNIFLGILCIFLIHANTQAMWQTDQKKYESRKQKLWQFFSFGYSQAMSQADKKKYESELRELLQVNGESAFSSFIELGPANKNEINYAKFFNSICRGLENAQPAMLISTIGINYNTEKIILSDLPQKELVAFANALNLPILILPDREPNRGAVCQIAFYNPRLNQWDEKKIKYGGSLKHR